MTTEEKKRAAKMQNSKSCLKHYKLNQYQIGRFINQLIDLGTVIGTISETQFEKRKLKLTEKLKRYEETTPDFSFDLRTEQGKQDLQEFIKS